MAKHPDFKLLNANEILSQQQINLNTGKYLKLLPHLHHTDGFFAAVFEKIELANASVKKAESEVVSSVAVNQSDVNEAQPITVAVQAIEEPAQDSVAAVKPKAKKVKAPKVEAALEEVASEVTELPAKPVKPKVDKVVKEKVVKEKVAKPKAVKAKTVKA